MAATGSFRQRIATILHGSPHYVTLSDPAPTPTDGNRKILLTPNPSDATNIHFSAITGIESSDGKDIADGVTPHYVEFTDISYTEPCLLRPRLNPSADMPTQLGTVVAGLTPTPITWVRKPTAGDTTFTLHLASDPDQTVIVSHSAGILPKKEPYLLISTADALPAKFWTERLCDHCNMVWTDTIASFPCCSFCRAQELTDEYIVKHGHSPTYPCRACGELTPYGGFCSSACRSDYED